MVTSAEWTKDQNHEMLRLQKKFHGNGIVLNVDGDFACGTECEEQHERNMHAIGEACQTEAGFFAWMAE